MKNAAEVSKITSILKKHYPDAKIALDFRSVWELLVVVVLSAQCTDVRVNKISPALFKKFPKIKDFARANLSDIEQLIYSTGFYKNKAKNIKLAAEKIVKDFGGKVPNKMKDLLKLPGIARKSANVILGDGFGKPEGITVDTHVIRLSGLIGLTDAKLSKTKNAVKIEQELMKIVPKKDWGIFSHLLVSHGRRICIARKPKCEECPIRRLCDYGKKIMV